MDPTSPTDRFLAEAEWARALASRLVRDAASADDLVQEAWLAATRRPPSDEHAVRPWLATVLRNAARQLRRTDGRRTRREANAARAEALPSARELVEKAEAQRALLDAVLALPEPLRRTVMLRHFEGLTAAEIARQTATNPATVRWHLQSALTRLRDTLDARFGGDRRAWALALVPLTAPSFTVVPAAAAGGATATTSLTLGIGGLMLTKKAVLALAGVAAVVLGLYGAMATFGHGGDDLGPTEDATTAPAVASTTAASTAAATELGDAAVAAARQSVAPPVAPSHLVVGRCVDRRGEPLGGCAIRITARPSDPNAAFLQRTPRPCGETTSGTDGRFVLQLDAATAASEHEQLTIHVDRADLLGTAGVIARPTADRSADLGDIVLATGARLRATVVDEAGTPRGGVGFTFEIGVPRLGNEAVTTLEVARSAADGTLQIANDPLLPAGAWDVTVDPALELVEPTRLVVPADASVATPHFVVRERSLTDAIHGRLVDENGLPLGGVRIEANDTGARPDTIGVATSDLDGTFALFRSAANTPAVTLRIDGDAEFGGVHTTPIPWGSTGIEVVRPRGVRLALHVHDAQGRPVERFGVQLAWSEDRNAFPALVADGSHVDGRVEIPGLGREGHVALLVWPRDDVHGGARPRRITLPAGGVVPVDIELPTLVEIAVDVRDVGGMPVAGSTVELVQVDRAPFSATTQVLQPLAVQWNFGAQLEDWPVPFRITQAETDDSGTALLRCPTPCDNVGLRVTGPGHTTTTVHPLASPRSGTRIEVTVTAAGHVEGTVGPEGIAARFSRGLNMPNIAREPIGILLRSPDGATQLGREPGVGQVVGADGTFVIESVPAGTWDVLLTWWRPSGPDSATSTVARPPLATITVTAGATTRVDVDLSRHAPAVVRGRVLVDGRPAAWARVSFTSRWHDVESGDQVEAGIGASQTDAEGRFEIAGLMPGDHLLLVQPADRDPAVRLPAVEWLHIAAGATVERDFEIVDRTLQVRLVTADGAVVADQPVLVVQDTYRRAWDVTTDADGLLTIADVGLGRVQLALRDAAPPTPTEWAPSLVRSGTELEPIEVERGAEPLRVTRRVR